MKIKQLLYEYTNCCEIILNGRCELINVLKGAFKKIKVKIIPEMLNWYFFSVNGN